MAHTKNQMLSLSTMRCLTVIISLASTSVDALSCRVKPVSRSNHISRLRYTSGADNEHTLHRTEGSNGWWNSIFSREEPSPADDYLEFLERRYNRILHDDNDTEQQHAGSKRGFSVLQWLYEDSEQPEGSSHAKHSKEDDALYVLGVANLASKRLLQKHHLLDQVAVTRETPESLSKKKSAIDAEILVTPTRAVSKPLVGLLHQIALLRQFIIQHETRSLSSATKFLMRKMFTTGRACQKLFHMGGAKVTWTVTLAALAAALSIVIHPLGRAVAAQGASSFRP